MTGTPWPCRRPNARMPVACWIQGDSPSLVRYHGEPGNYLQHATNLRYVDAYTTACTCVPTLPASPSFPSDAPRLAFVASCCGVSFRFVSFRFAPNARRENEHAPIRTYRQLSSSRPDSIRVADLAAKLELTIYTCVRCRSRFWSGFRCWYRLS